MNRNRLAKGECIILDNGKTATVIDDSAFASGSQALLYHAKYEGEEVVLKWYHKEYDTVFYQEIRKKISALMSANCDVLIAPIACTIVKRNHFGYLMKEIPNTMYPLSSLIERTKNSEIISKECFNVAYNISRSVMKIHDCGFIFNDISDLNIFYDNISGNILFCDCDSISTSDSPPIVFGQNAYVAPEIKKKTISSALTDNYSLAVLLFKLLVCSNVNFLHTNYNDHSEYVSDEDKIVTDNIIARWKSLNNDIKEAFTKSLVDGEYDTNCRINAKEWADLLSPHHYLS